MNRLRLAILISGRGSNMRALVEAAGANDYPAEPVLVLSNRPDAAGLAWAETRGVATEIVDHKQFGRDRQTFETEIDHALARHQIDFIALAGFMRILTPWFVDRWAGRMINIHPSLLPKYPGLDTHARAIAAGDAVHGCTVHWVTAGVDAGDIIGQRSVRIVPDDTPDTLAARVLEQEHILYPEALAEACKTVKPR